MKTNRSCWGRQCILICQIFLALACYAAERFQLNVQSSQTEDGLVTRNLLSTDNNKFSFMAPTPEWQVSANPAEKTITFTSPDRTLAAVMQVTRVDSQVPGQPPKLDPERLRIEVLAQFPGAKITEESVSYTGSGTTGQTFDLEWEKGKNRFGSRVVYISFPGEIVQYSMATPIKDFKPSQPFLTRLLASLQVETLVAKN